MGLFGEVTLFLTSRLGVEGYTMQAGPADAATCCPQTPPRREGGRGINMSWAQDRRGIEKCKQFVPLTPNPISQEKPPTQ